MASSAGLTAEQALAIARQEYERQRQEEAERQDRERHVARRPYWTPTELVSELPVGTDGLPRLPPGVYPHHSFASMAHPVRADVAEKAKRLPDTAKTVEKLETSCAMGWWKAAGSGST
jgi:hypothetical protein